MMTRAGRCSYEILCKMKVLQVVVDNDSCRAGEVDIHSQCQESSLSLSPSRRHFSFSLCEEDRGGGVRPSFPFIKIACSSREKHPACVMSQSLASVAWNRTTAPQSVRIDSIPFGGNIARLHERPLLDERKPPLIFHASGKQWRVDNNPNHLKKVGQSTS